MKPGRIIGTALLGFLTMLFVALDLVLFGVIPLNSVVVTILPAVGLVGGGVLGAMAGKRLTAAAATPGATGMAPAVEPAMAPTAPPPAAPTAPPPPAAEPRGFSAPPPPEG